MKFALIAALSLVTVSAFASDLPMIDVTPGAAPAQQRVLNIAKKAAASEQTLVDINLKFLSDVAQLPLTKNCLEQTNVRSCKKAFEVITSVIRRSNVSLQTLQNKTIEAINKVTVSSKFTSKIDADAYNSLTKHVEVRNVLHDSTVVKMGAELASALLVSKIYGDVDAPAPVVAENAKQDYVTAAKALSVYLVTFQALAQNEAKWFADLSQGITEKTK